MNEPQPVSFQALLSQLPPPWHDGSLRQQIARQNRRGKRCVVALDDDPTGTQTMHDIWVLTCWDEDDIFKALQDNEPALYIMTNSRSVSLEEAQAMNRAIAANLYAAAQRLGRSITLVSRSDSTLRGHFPGEIEALQQTLFEKYRQQIDGVCLLPFFAEGGRFTIQDVHWVLEGENLIPAAQTPYARDAVFGYRHSYLPDWVQEKTAGRVSAGQVVTITLEALRLGGPQQVFKELMEIRGGKVVVVNAAADRDLEVFVAGLLKAEDRGKAFLFRSAASFVKIAAGLPDKPLLTPGELLQNRSANGGLIVFGSYVPKSTAQLETLRQMEGIHAIEMPAARVLDPGVRAKTIAEIASHANHAIRAGQDALVFTSRELVTGADHAANLAIGKSISSALMEVVDRIEVKPGFVIGKGGITSSDLATRGMQVRAARVMGQVLPGVPVWKLAEGSRWPGLVYTVFPGNVGDSQAVARVVQSMRQ